MSFSYGSDAEPTVPVSRATPVDPVDPPRRRRRRWWIPLLIALVALLALVVAADRVAPVLVGRTVAARLQTQLHTPERPQVHVTGFPFLTQVAAGDYRRVTVDAADVPVDAPGGGLTLDRVSAELTDVRPVAGGSRLRVGQLTGTATLGYPALSNYVGQTISYAGADGGRGRIKLGVRVAGADLATLSGVPVVQQDQQRLTLQDPRLELAGRELPSALIESLLDRVFHPQLPALAPGLRISTVRATAAGVRVDGGGRNLTLGG
jgi:hypothetical protein